MRTLLIIPAYNEQDCIVSTVEAVEAAGFDYLVVNDGSTDRTGEICRERGFNHLDLKENLGIGGAVQAGHKYAYRNGYDVDVQFDGDGQHDVAYVAALIEQIGDGADLVIGSRYLEKSAGFRSTRMRRLGGKWLSGAIRFVSGLKVSDPTSGFRATGRRAMELFCRDYPSDYPEPESIVVAARRGLHVKEVQVEMHERQGGASSISPLSSIYYMVKVTMAIVLVGLGRSKG